MIVVHLKKQLSWIFKCVAVAVTAARGTATNLIAIFKSNWLRVVTAWNLKIIIEWFDLIMDPNGDASTLIVRHTTISNLWIKLADNSQANQDPGSTISRRKLKCLQILDLYIKLTKIKHFFEVSETIPPLKIWTLIFKVLCK